MGCEKYFNEVKGLYAESVDYVEVGHDPMSTRYSNAQYRLKDLIGHSVCIGFSDNGETGELKDVEVVTWLEPSNARYKKINCGEYAVFKIGYFQTGLPKYSHLFAYYDDEPSRSDKRNVPLYNKNEAINFMKTFNKYSVCEGL